MSIAQSSRPFLRQLPRRIGLALIVLLVVVLVGAFAAQSAFAAPKSHEIPTYNSFSGAYWDYCAMVAGEGNAPLVQSDGQNGAIQVCASGAGYLGLPESAYNSPTMWCGGGGCNSSNSWFKGYDIYGNGFYLGMGKCANSCNDLLKITQICPLCGNPPANSIPVTEVAAPAPAVQLTQPSPSPLPAYASFSGNILDGCGFDALWTYGSGNFIWNPNGSTSDGNTECASGSGYNAINITVYQASDLDCQGDCNGWFRGYDDYGNGFYLSYNTCASSCNDFLKITQSCAQCGSPPANVQSIETVAAPTTQPKIPITTP